MSKNLKPQQVRNQTLEIQEFGDDFHIMEYFLDRGINILIFQHENEFDVKIISSFLVLHILAGFVHIFLCQHLNAGLIHEIHIEPPHAELAFMLSLSVPDLEMYITSQLHIFRNQQLNFATTIDTPSASLFHIIAIIDSSLSFGVLFEMYIDRILSENASLEKDKRGNHNFSQIVDQVGQIFGRRFQLQDLMEIINIPLLTWYDYPLPVSSPSEVVILYSIIFIFKDFGK